MRILNRCPVLPRRGQPFSLILKPPTKACFSGVRSPTGLVAWVSSCCLSQCFPILVQGGKQLFKSESPGPDPRGLSPRIKDTASILYKIYFGLTVIQTLLLMFAGMSFLRCSLPHFRHFGYRWLFSPGAPVSRRFDSVAIDGIIIFFMVLAGTNFALFFAMLQGSWTALFKNTEWRVYIGILAVATLLITFNLIGVQGVASLPIQDDTPGLHAPHYTLPHALRVAAFQVVLHYHHHGLRYR